MKYRNLYKKYLTDWRLYYKLVLFMLVLTGLIITIVDWEINLSTGERFTIVLQDGTIVHQYSDVMSFFFSFFTNQSNIIVLIWLFASLLFPWKEGKKYLGSTSQLIVATYITITTLIFWLMITPSNAIAGKLNYSPIEWFSTVLLHLISGVGFCLYVIMWSTKYEHRNAKNWFTELSWITLIYPIVYSICIFIRGELRLKAHKESSTIYPYFFFEIHKTINGMPGWVWTIIAIVIIGCLCVGISTLYSYAISKNKYKYLTDKQKEQYLEKMA